MKARLVAAVLSICSLGIAVAQDGQPSRPAPSQVSLTDATATATSDASTNKPDIKELMKQDSFTNAIGMVMVKISSALWVGRFDVTQKEYEKVMGANPSQFSGDRNPVDSVSWNDARDYCAKLTESERKEEMLPEGFSYSLPTQAQWESLMRDATLQDAVTSQGTRRPGTAPVGSLGANSLGLYDTRGNVWQWCLDPQDKPYRVLRGGAWDTTIEINLRPEFRWYSTGPDDKKNVYGFRCVLEPSGGM
jgi:formylglycine-generating enzyme required for sulfatase activity